MIDPRRETLLDPLDATMHVPPNRTGRRVHQSSVRRWMLQGLRGVRLESIKIGQRRCTSVEALDRFFIRLTDSNTPRERTIVHGG